MIDWFGFVIVGLTTLIGAGFVVGMYSLGVRFTAFSGDDGGRVNQAAKWASYICFGFDAGLLLSVIAARRCPASDV